MKPLEFAHGSKKAFGEKNLTEVIICIVSLVCIFGCVSTPKGEPTVVGPVGLAEGQWRGKALVNNWKTKQKAYLDVDILAREPSQLRMEITGSFGVHVASIALSGQEVTYILSQEKRFIEVPASADALVRIVPIRVPPDVLLAILFERELPRGEWKCDIDRKNQLPMFCVHKGDDVAVKWIERNGRNRRLKITAKEAEVELVLDEAKSKVELKNDAFKLSPPSGFKQERLTSS